MATASGITADDLTSFRAELIQNILESFDGEKSPESRSSTFIVLAKMCSENAAKLKDEIKIQYTELLQKFIKNVVSEIIL